MMIIINIVQLQIILIMLGHKTFIAPKTNWFRLIKISTVCFVHHCSKQGHVMIVYPKMAKIFNLFNI